jgi:hypothetical protein
LVVEPTSQLWFWLEARQSHSLENIDTITATQNR